MNVSAKEQECAQNFQFCQNHILLSVMSTHIFMHEHVLERTRVLAFTEFLTRHSADYLSVTLLHVPKCCSYSVESGTY